MYLICGYLAKATYFLELGYDMSLSGNAGS